MPENKELAVTANKSGLLEIVAIAKPGPDEALAVGGGVWIQPATPPCSSR